VAAIVLARDERDLAERAAERFTVLAEQSIATRDGVRISLTGGTTPKRMYELLGNRARPWRGRIDWTRVHLYWGDERHVPPDHPDSNYGMAARAFINDVPIPPDQVHRIRGELADATEAAREYERLIPDRFDVMLLGVGADGHIASIFPNSPLLDFNPDSGPPADPVHRVAAVWAPHLNAWRITLTPPAILDALTIVLLVSGESKAAAIQAAFEAPLDVRRHPVQLLRAADHRTEWFLDRGAATALRSSKF
jgi:6-phosphogluconolactonase